MSGPKCGELSYELNLLNDTFDVLVGNSVKGAASVIQGTASAVYSGASELNQKRKQYIIDSKIAALKLKIHSKLSYLEELHSSAEKIGDDEHYSSIVNVPTFSDMTTLKEYENGLEELDQVILKYQSHIAEFFEKKLLEEKMGLQDLSQIASDDAEPFITANAVIRSIENEASFANKKKDQRVISQYGEKIQKLFSDMSKKYPGSVIPSSIIDLSTRLLSSKNLAQAQNRYDKINTMLEAHETDLEEEAIEAAQIREQEEKDNINTMIGMVIASTFEEMGYEVSGIEETCYVRNGEIFAQHSQFPNHAIKLTLDKENNHKISSEPVKVGPANEAYESESSGTEFDRFWCSKGQVGELRKRLKEKNLGLSLKPVKPGIPDKKAENKLPESIKDKDAYAKKINRLLNQTNAPKLRTR